MRYVKLLIIYIFLISLCLSLVGCGLLFDSLKKEDFELLHESSKIEAIQIVEVGEVKTIEDTSSNNYKVLYEPSFDVIAEIEDIEQFMEDFSQVDCFQRLSDPSKPFEGDKGIKIIYNNGDYDVICSNGQAECENGIYNFERGYNSFDDTQFDELINKYTKNIEIR